jgi:hypothetical protein
MWALRVSARKRRIAVRVISAVRGLSDFLLENDEGPAVRRPKFRARVSMRACTIRLACLLGAQIGLSFPAAASMICMRLSELGAPIPEVRRRIVLHAETELRLVPTDIRRFHNGNFYIVRSSEDKCRSSLCHYHIVQVNPDSVHDIISFVGTGWMRVNGTQVNLYHPDFGTHFSSVVLEGIDKSYLNFGFPSIGSMVVVDGASAADVGLPRCK